MKSEDVPSKISLLPRSRDIIEDYDEEETEFEEDSEDEETYQKTKVVQRPVTKLPIMPLAMSSKEGTKAESDKDSKVWGTSVTPALTTLDKCLPQSEPKVSQAYIPPSADNIHSKPRLSEKLPALASRDLGAISESEATSLSASSIPRVTNAPKVISAALRAESNFMWTRPPEQAEVYTTGLFSLNARRSEFRMTQATPVANPIIRTPRLLNAPIPFLLSENLWTPERSVKKPTVWISLSTVSQPQISAQALWKSVTNGKSVDVVGLFSLSHARSDYRITTLLPAAQDMKLRTRPSSGLLSSLTSTSLWRLPSSPPYEHHWISESSVRPDSPSVYSEPSSGRSSPASEASSISGASLKSTSTKASSIWGSIKSASTPVWWDAMGSRKRLNPPPNGEIPENSKSLSILPVAKGLAAIKESRVLASRDMWEAKAPISQKEAPEGHSRGIMVMKKETDVAEVVKQSPRRQTTPTVTFEANRDEALAQTRPAGTPKEVLSRPMTNQADWDAALLHEISKSKPRVQRPKATPKMWQAALEEAIAKSSLPMEVNVPRYNSAVLHPVFFASSLVSYVADIHPAAIGHVVRPEAPSLWTAPHSHPTVLEAPSPAPAPRSLKSNDLFNTTSTASHEVTTWLHATSTPTIRAIPNASMWMAPKKLIVSKISEPHVSSHIQAQHVKKSTLGRPAPLARLASNELFSSAEQLKISTHWLHSTCSSTRMPVPSSPVIFAAAPQPTTRSQTWTAPRRPLLLEEQQDSKIMWNFQPLVGTEEEQAIFSNPHTEPWSRKKRSDSGVEIEVEGLESKKLWSRKWTVPESPKRWLEGCEGSFSKVQFRY